MSDERPAVIAGSDAARDGIAFARAIGRGDLDGAWAILGPKDRTERMVLTVFLAAHLYRLVGEDDEAWLTLLADCDDIPDAPY